MAQRIESPGADLELGYWAIRGLAQPIRFMLAYAGVSFCEVRLGVTQDGDIIEDEAGDWNAHRATLDMPFPNLPYLIDRGGREEIRLTQSNAVLRYLARRFDLYGDSDAERTDIDVIQEEAYDFRNRIVKAAYTLGDGYRQAYDDLAEVGMPRHLDGFERYLASRPAETHFVGKRLSLVDFLLYELVWQASVMVPGSVTATARPTLHAFIQRFAALPAIAAYMKSEHYIDRPINSVWASFT